VTDAQPSGPQQDTRESSGVADDIGYAAAMEELEAILDEIEQDDVDVDLLSQRVIRAAELIKLCRTRIRATRLEVEEIVAGLDEDDPTEEEMA
jgi:exodeoxyribonuclease VII small subunit